MKILKNKKIIIGSLFTVTIAASFLIGCNNNGGDKKSEEGYKVTYHAGDGHQINGVQDFTSKNITNIEIEPTPDYSKGNKFLGWYYSKEETAEKVQFPKKVSNDMDFYAKWESGEYGGCNTVKFNTDGGTAVPNYLIPEEGCISGSPCTSKEGFEFLGWKDIESLESDYITFPYYPTQDTTLKAEWKQVAYKAVLHTKGTAPKGYEKKTSSSQEYVSTKFEKEIQSYPHTSYTDCSFNGWFDNPECEGDPVEFPYTLSENKKDLYASFGDDSSGYTLTLTDASHGTKEVDMENCKVIPYQPDSIYEDTTKTFKGWEDSEGNPVTFPLTITSDTTINAIWDDRTPRYIMFDDDGVKTTKKYYEGQVINDPPKIEKQDYLNFDGWFKADLKTRINFPFTVGSQNETFYTKTTRNKFDVNILDSEDEQTVLFNTTVTGSYVVPNVLVHPDPTRKDDYTLFEGLNAFYYKNASNADVPIARGTEFKATAIEDILDGNTLKLYAKWQDNRRYLVSINYEDGKTPFKLYNSTKTPKTVADLPTFSDRYQDKSIEYWYNKDDPTEQYIPGTTTALPFKELKLEVKWKAKYRNLKVYRGGIFGKEDYPTYDNVQVVCDDAVSAEVPATLLSNISHSSYSNYQLVGYYNEKPTPTSKLYPLTTAVTSTDFPTVAYEAWELISGNVTINYYTDTTKNTKLGSVTKTNSPLTFNYSLIKPTSYPDYTEWQTIKVNDNEEIQYSKQAEDPTLSLTKYNNVIDVCLKQSLFTVTYNPNYDGAIIHKKEHCNKFESIIPSYPDGGKTFNGWYYQYGPEIKEGDTITEDITVYADWKEPTGEIAIEFNVGSTQLAATFENNVKTKTATTSGGTLSPSNFPVATCEGMKFDGWYESEVATEGETNWATETITTTHYPTNKKLYARWMQTGNSISIVLKIEDDEGNFVNGTKSAIVTVQPGKKWSEIKEFIPGTTYQGEEYIVGSWKNTSGTTITDTTTFNTSQFIYAVKKDNINIPTGDFERDNWATVNAVAKNQLSKSGTTYANGLKALEGFYNLQVGATKYIGIPGVKCEARVIGLGQDYGDKNCGTKLPVTFELTELLCTDVFGTSVSDYNWSNCQLNTSLKSGGTISEYFPDIINTNVSTVYKVTKEGKVSTSSRGKTSYTIETNMIENKMFVPSLYEIYAIKTGAPSNSIVYDLYKKATDEKLKEYIMKEYNFTASNYWSRDIDDKFTSGSRWNHSYIKIILDGTSVTYSTSDQSTPNVVRGVNVMFCLGTKY